MEAATSLRTLLNSGPVVAASVFDPLSARLAELAGFQTLHLSGFAIEASLIGAPDLGIISMSELVQHASRISDTVSIPLLSDIDTGFGGINNVVRTVRQMEKAGMAGVHIEDQTFPKRCPLLDGRTVVPVPTAVGRIKAALDARRSEEFVIVARTDADTLSINDLIERGNIYLEAGADMIMPAMLNVDGRSFQTLDASSQMDVYHRICSGIKGRVMTLGMAFPQGKTVDDMITAGFSYVMIANSGLTAAANALSQVYRELMQTGTDAGYFAKNQGLYTNRLTLLDALHVKRYLEMDEKYAPAPPA